MISSFYLLVILFRVFFDDKMYAPNKIVDKNIEL